MSTAVFPLDIAIQQATETAGPASRKSNHRANIIRISEVLPHPDPETTNLELIHIDGYQVVTRKGEFKVGDLGVYIQPDSVVPQTPPFEFIWGPYVAPGLTDGFGSIPEKRRRITVRKFRGQWSEGLLLPVSDFDALYVCSTQPQEGMDVSDLLGITHYDPDAGTEGVASTRAAQTHSPKHKHPKTLKGWFFYILFLLGFRSAHKSYAQEVSFHLPTYDVEAFKNYKNVFKEGEPVVVTEKIHGSNARFIFLDGTMYAGSRTQWKAPGSNDVWHRALKDNPWIESWCRMHEGYALYGEVAPTQRGFDYGAAGEIRFFIFDVLTAGGKWMPFSLYQELYLNDRPFLDFSNDFLVPVLYAGPFNTEEIMKLVDGPSQVKGAKHIREGIVIKPLDERHERGLGRVQLKVVSNAFLAKDSK